MSPSETPWRDALVERRNSLWNFHGGSAVGSWFHAQDILDHRHFGAAGGQVALCERTLGVETHPHQRGRDFVFQRRARLHHRQRRGQPRRSIDILGRSRQWNEAERQHNQYVQAHHATSLSRRTSSMKARTRSTSTGFSQRPPCFRDEPMMTPFARG